MLTTFGNIPLARNPGALCLQPTSWSGCGGSTVYQSLSFTSMHTCYHSIQCTIIVIGRVQSRYIRMCIYTIINTYIHAHIPYIRMHKYLHLVSTLWPSTLSHSEPRQTQFLSCPTNEIHQEIPWRYIVVHLQHTLACTWSEELETSRWNEARQLTLTSLAYIVNLEWSSRTML